MVNSVQIDSAENVIRGSFRKNIVQRILGKLRVWNQRRLAIIELNAMSDSLLRDLGIERYQINEVVNRGGSFAEFRSERNAAPVVAPMKKAAA